MSAEAPLARIRARVLSGLAGEASAPTASPFWRPSLLAGAALLVVAVSSALLLWHGRAGDEPVYRGPIFRIQAQVARDAGQPIVIRWKGVPDAEYYNLDIYRADLKEIVYRSRITETRYTLSQQEMQLLSGEGPFFCRIEAMNEFNEELAKSESLTFTLTADSSGVLAASRD